MGKILEGESDTDAEVMLTEEILQRTVEGETVTVTYTGCEIAVLHTETDFRINRDTGIKLLPSSLSISSTIASLVG